MAINPLGDIGAETMHSVIKQCVRCVCGVCECAPASEPSVI